MFCETPPCVSVMWREDILLYLRRLLATENHLGVLGSSWWPEWAPLKGETSLT